jgi:hypothetical protein
MEGAPSASGNKTAFLFFVLFVVWLFWLVGLELPLSFAVHPPLPPLRVLWHVLTAPYIVGAAGSEKLVPWLPSALCTASHMPQAALRVVFRALKYGLEMPLDPGT